MEPECLKQFLLKGKSSPVVFREKLSNWSALEWTPDNIASVFGEDLQVRMRLGRKENPSGSVLWEQDCDYEETSMHNVCEWLMNSQREECSSSTTGEANDECNPLDDYPHDEYWGYVDYKHLAELVPDSSSVLEAIDWSGFGFPGRNGKESTLWLGSAGAHTPCHFDSYGCNLVAQIYGRKRWVLFPPEATRYLYPTRLPYEESSVFSKVNISQPNIKEFPQFFAEAQPYVVVLEPGDVLYVPPQWWHYVQCESTAISVNTWISIDNDDHTRLHESVSRMLVTSLMMQSDSSFDTWLNPTEELTDFNTNNGYIEKALRTVRKKSNSTKTFTRKSVSSVSISNKDSVSHQPLDIVCDPRNMGLSDNSCSNCDCDNKHKAIQTYPDMQLLVSAICVHKPECRLHGIVIFRPSSVQSMLHGFSKDSGEQHDNQLHNGSTRMMMDNSCHTAKNMQRSSLEAGGPIPNKRQKITAEEQHGDEGLVKYDNTLELDALYKPENYDKSVSSSTTLDSNVVICDKGLASAMYRSPVLPPNNSDAFTASNKSPTLSADVTSEISVSTESIVNACTDPRVIQLICDILIENS